MKEQLLLRQKGKDGFAQNQKRSPQVGVNLQNKKRRDAPLFYYLNAEFLDFSTSRSFLPRKINLTGVPSKPSVLRNWFSM